MWIGKGGDCLRNERVIVDGIRFVHYTADGNKNWEPNESNKICLPPLVLTQVHFALMWHL